MKPKTRKILRFLGIGFLITTVSLAGLAYGAVSFLKQAVSRIEIDTTGLSKAIEDAILLTLSEGTPQQKIELIGSFVDAPPESASYFRPLLDQAAKDKDLQVREAASKALERFNTSKAQP